MKVKIGTTVYDSNVEPIMVMLDSGDKALINDMNADQSRFCSFPLSATIDDIIEFMRGFTVQDVMKFIPEDTK